MSLQWVEPTNAQEASECIRDASRVFLCGAGAYTDFRLGPFPKVEMAFRRDSYEVEKAKNTSFPHWDEALKKLQTDPELSIFDNASCLSLEEMNHEIVVHAEDQVAVVPADLPIGNVNAHLQRYGLCIPIGDQDDFGLAAGLSTIGSLVSLNLPHVLESQCGSWKDWILGMNVVLADGTLAKGGSKAVKNVAGYDVHKFMVGTRGSLGLILDITLRLTPIAAKPKPNCVLNRVPVIERSLWIQRVQKSDFTDALKGATDHLLLADRETGTIWAKVGPDETLPRYSEDWVIRSGCGDKNLEISDSAQIAFMKRAKAVFDPTNKLNHGEWGFM